MSSTACEIYSSSPVSLVFGHKDWCEIFFCVFRPKYFSYSKLFEFVVQMCVIIVCVFWELCVVTVRETKTQLPLFALRKVWGEAVSYICGLKEDYIRLYRGQRAAM